jgi:monoamine oxidase
MGSRLGRLLDIAYNTEYGAECSEQSALNLIYLLGYSGVDQPGIFGTSDERYHVRGGSDRIAGRLAKRLTSQIELGTALVAIRRLDDGGYELHLRRGKVSRSITAGRVVLAIPFSVLRTSVDYAYAGFNAIKRKAIAELGMGTNSKLHLQTVSRHWETNGCNGSTISETGYQTTWESTRGQSGAGGILANYTGGKVGASYGKGTEQELAKQLLTQLEPLMPGITHHWNGRASIDCWPDYQWTRGSFSYWKVGQYTRFAGAERERSGNCHFAGEHTSIEYQGYMNGAVESGERAAAEILSDLRNRS